MSKCTVVKEVSVEGPYHNTTTIEYVNQQEAYSIRKNKGLEKNSSMYIYMYMYLYMCNYNAHIHR